MGDSPPNYAGDTLSGTTGLSVDPADPRDTSPGGRSFTVKPSDEVLSSLKCAICMEYCLKTVTLAPCFHSFCGHCLTTWFQTGEKDFNLEDQDERRRRGKKCPICRNAPNVASRNLIMDEFVRGYLASHPEERRSDAEIEIITRQENIFLENITQLQTSRLRSEQNTHILETSEPNLSSMNGNPVVNDRIGGSSLGRRSSTGGIQRIRHQPQHFMHPRHQHRHSHVYISHPHLHHHPDVHHPHRVIPEIPEHVPLHHHYRAIPEISEPPETWAPRVRMDWEHFDCNMNHWWF